MKSLPQTAISQYSLSAITAFSVALFFGLCYPHHLHFQEQYQLFLFDADYAIDILRLPGGLADYLGRFFTQFFLYGWVGATIIGLMIATSQAIASRHLAHSRLLFLSVLPALLETRILCDEDALLGTVLAIVLSQSGAWCISMISSQRLRRYLSVILFPVIYWAAGPIAFLYAMLVIIDEWRGCKTLNTGIWTAIFAFVSLVLPYFSSQYIAVEPQKLYSGIHYYRTYAPDMSAMLWAVSSLVLIEAVSLFLVHRLQVVRLSWLQPVLFIVCGIAGFCFLVYPSANFKAEEVMGYDYMARFQQWNRIEQTADHNKPHNPLSMTAVNLSLGMKGKLTSKLTHFPQRGTSGLLPSFSRDMTSPLVTSEVYYQLGMINTAQRLTFEAQEAIYDYQKSGRCYKRLAETSLILGNYKVAQKYISALRKTLFYSRWANDAMKLLADEDAINSHPEYGRLRKMIGKTDCFFNETDLAEMLKNHLSGNPDNLLAQQYLLSIYYLTGNR